MGTHKNEVLLAGQLTKDPIVRVTGTGRRVANLSLVTVYKGSRGEKREHHKVTCWESLAEQVASLKKNDFLCVSGYLSTQSWEDSDRVKHWTTSVIACRVSTSEQDESLGKDVAAAILRPGGGAR